jgi:butyrate kinase
LHRILVINPGSTSTKIAVYENEQNLLHRVLSHSSADLARFSSVNDQQDYRWEHLLEALQESNCSLSGFSAVAARGGLLKPLSGGVYLIDDEMDDDLVQSRYGEHASNLGGLLARRLALELGIPAFTVDPVSVDELEEPARFSGLNGITRVSLSHALNTKAVSRRVAERMGREYGEVNLVVAHLGSGISVSAHRKGRMVDVNNANNEGPFSLERCGTLPALSLINLGTDGKHTRQELIGKVTRTGGVYSYLGTKDLQAVEQRIAQGDREAETVIEAMCYQVAKEIGAMAAVLEGKVDWVILTGGMAFSKRVTGSIERRVAFIAPVVIESGEAELEALALGALRVLRGTETVRAYGTKEE